MKLKVIFIICALSLIFCGCKGSAALSARTDEQQQSIVDMEAQIKKMQKEFDAMKQKVDKMKKDISKIKEDVKKVQPSYIDGNIQEGN